MARIARTSYARDDMDEEEDDLYSDPYRDQAHSANQHRHISSTPGPQSAESFSTSSTPLTNISDKENPPRRSGGKGSATSPHTIKKERGLSPRLSPYPGDTTSEKNMASRKSTVAPLSSRGSRQSATPATTSKVSKTSKASAKSRASRASKTPAPSVRRPPVASRAASRVPETDDDDEMEEPQQQELEEEEVVDEEEEEAEEPADSDLELDDRGNQIPPSAQRQRQSITPEPSPPPRRSRKQTPPPSQGPSRSQMPDPSQFYDPHQSMVEIRNVNRAYRDIQQDLTDNRDNLLKAGNTELFDIIEKTEELFANVKQTTTALVDGKVQVEIAKLAAEKAAKIGGSTNTGLNIDEFISKVKIFMAKGKNAQDDDVDNHAWDYLGAQAAAPCMKRAMPSDFMYGPLAVQKRQRIVKERKRMVRRKPEEYVKPIELDEKQVAKNENATTKNVMHINDALEKYLQAHPELEDCGVNYFRFIINPHSYSQTIENMFYLAFLVRDGRVAMVEDEDYGLPYLICAEPPSPEEAAQQQIVRKQIVMPMDKRTWRELIEVFQITDTIVPTRPREVEAINASGWYSESGGSQSFHVLLPKS